MTTMLIIYVLIFFMGLFNAGMDAIKFKTKDFRLQSDFWLSRGKFTPGNRTLLERHLFTFVADGWHLLKNLMVIFIGIAIYIAVVCTGIDNGRSEAIIPVVYFSFSLGHIIGYNYLWVK